MNISEEENDFTKRVLESGKPTNDADIITYIETIHSIAKKKLIRRNLQKNYAILHKFN